MNNTFYSRENSTGLCCFFEHVSLEKKIFISFTPSEKMNHIGFDEIVFFSEYRMFSFASRLLQGTLFVNKPVLHACSQTCS